MAYGEYHSAEPGRLPSHTALKITRRTAILSTLVALSLVLIKAIAWIQSDSVAMLSTLADSGLDATASFFTLLAVSYAAIPPDREHRFGHGKMEGFAALFQALLVIVSAVLISVEAIERMSDPQPVLNSYLAMGVMLVSIVMTTGLVWVQTQALHETGSTATKGDRAHYIADLAANISVLLGIFFSYYLGWRWVDPFIGLGVAVWLAYGALDVARAGFDLLLDRELSDEARAKIRALALEVPGILDVHALRTRASGSYIHIQFHATLNPAQSLIDAHKIMVACEKNILEAYPAADIIIHPDPGGHAEPHGHEDFRKNN